MASSPKLFCPAIPQKSISFLISPTDSGQDPNRLALTERLRCCAPLGRRPRERTILSTTGVRRAATAVDQPDVAEPDRIPVVLQFGRQSDWTFRSATTGLVGQGDAVLNQ